MTMMVNDNNSVDCYCFDVVIRRIKLISKTTNN